MQARMPLPNTAGPPAASGMAGATQNVPLALTSLDAVVPIPLDDQQVAVSPGGKRRQTLLEQHAAADASPSRQSPRAGHTVADNVVPPVAPLHTNSQLAPPEPQQTHYSSPDAAVHRILSRGSGTPGGAKQALRSPEVGSLFISVATAGQTHQNEASMLLTDIVPRHACHGDAPSLPTSPVASLRISLANHGELRDERTSTATTSMSSNTAATLASPKQRAAAQDTTTTDGSLGAFESVLNRPASAGDLGMSVASQEEASSKAPSSALEDAENTKNCLDAFEARTSESSRLALLTTTASSAAGLETFTVATTTVPDQPDREVLTLPPGFMGAFSHNTGGNNSATDCPLISEERLRALQSCFDEHSNSSAYKDGNPVAASMVADESPCKGATGVVSLPSGALKYQAFSPFASEASTTTSAASQNQATRGDSSCSAYTHSKDAVNGTGVLRSVATAASLSRRTPSVPIFLEVLSHTVSCEDLLAAQPSFYED